MSQLASSRGDRIEIHPRNCWYAVATSRGRRSRTAGPQGARNRCRLVPHHRRNSGRARGPLRAPALSAEPRPS